MAYVNKLWESEFDYIVSKKSNVQDLNINQLKTNYNIVFKKVEKLSTNFEPVTNEDVINKGF